MANNSRCQHTATDSHGQSSLLCQLLDEMFESLISSEEVSYILIFLYFRNKHRIITRFSSLLIFVVQKSTFSLLFHYNGYMCQFRSGHMTYGTRIFWCAILAIIVKNGSLCYTIAGLRRLGFSSYSH